MDEKKETLFKDDSLEEFRPISSSKCLFRATLDQININLRFSYTPKTVIPSQSLLPSGPITHLLQTKNHFVNPEQLKHQKVFGLYEDDVDLISGGQAKGERGYSKMRKSSNQIDLAKNQTDLRRALQSYEQNNEDENIGLKSNQIKCSKRFRKNQKKIWKEKKDREKYKDQIFESQESEPEEQQQLNKPQKRSIQQRIISIKEAKPQHKQFMSQKDRKKINQRVIGYQEKQTMERKKKRRQGDHPKKLNLSILQSIDENGYIKALKSSDDEQESIKPHSEDQQLKLRTERNRRIGVYIKRTLRAAKTRGGLVIRQLLISVLKNYEQQLNCIKDQQKRNKRFDCLRRRIYQSLSVLSAVGIIDKQKKEVNDKQKINLKSAENQSTRAKQRQKQELLARIKEKKMRIKFLKQKYFDAITRLRVIKCLDKRNNSEIQVRENQKIIFPFKIIAANRENMTLETIKSSPRLAKIDIVRIKATSIRPIHSIDMFILLRRILHLPPIQDCVKIDESLAKQYLDSIAKEDQYDKNKQIRLRLIQKMKQRKSMKQTKQTKENEKGRRKFREKEKEKGKEKEKEKEKGGMKGKEKARQKRELGQQQYGEQNKKQETMKKLRDKLAQKSKKKQQNVGS